MANRFLRRGDAMQGENQIGVAVTRCLPQANVSQFERGLCELVHVASSQPGHISAEILRGTVGPEGRWYYIVYRFSSETNLRAWEISRQRKSTVESLDPLAIDAGRQGLTGMEAWFDLHPSLAPPPRFRMAILTLIGIWPLVSVVLWLLAPHLTALPFLLRTAVNSTVLVIAMTYWVMPWLVRLADRWLRPSQLALSGIPKDRSKLFSDV